MHFLTDNKKIQLIILTLMALIGILWFSHKPQTKQTNLNRESSVLIYTRSKCLYCDLAKKLLEEKSFNYEVIELGNNEDLYMKLVDKTGQSTVPYVFIDNQFIGGYTELKKFIQQNNF